MTALTMKCPKCAQADLVTTERSEIEIDVCPACRGVWLDRGELDKLIERSVAVRGPASGRDWDHDEDGDDDDHHHSSRHGHHDGRDSRDDHGRPRRRHSWLSELFD